MKKVLSLTLPAFISLLSFVNAPARANELIFSAGVSTGDYNNSFTAGLSAGTRLWPFVHSEIELFYYRMPANRATTPGLAITSTALDCNVSALFQADIPNLRFVPYAALTAGRLYESETWKWSVTKTKAHKSYTRWDVGMGVGAKINLGGPSAARIDFRWLRILEKNHSVPRFTLGYILRF
jgi:hypothetical protein